MADRITRLRVEGLRSLQKIELELGGLTLLIGENGSGKSSIIEALQILSELGEGKGSFSSNFLQRHGGFSELLCDGAQRILFEVEAEIGGNPATYRIALENQGFGAMVVGEETFDLDTGREAGPLQVLQRNRQRCRAFSQTARKLVSVEVPANEPLLTAFGVLPPQAAIEPMRRLLSGIEARSALPVSPAWATRSMGRENPMRQSALVQPISRLSVLADELAAAWHVLRNDRLDAHWRETLDYIELGLGPDIQVLTPPDASAGRVGLALMIRGKKRFAAQLSEGTLSFLALIAAWRLGEGRTAMVLDEPDAHLHPALQARVMSFLEATSAEHPVVVATHSDTLLDCLADPVASTVVCDLGEDGETRLRRLDPEALSAWIRDYRGVGALRADGWLEQVVERAS